MSLTETSCERNLDDLIESLGTSATGASAVDTETSGAAQASEKVSPKHSQAEDEATLEGEEMKELTPGASDGEKTEEGDVAEDDDYEEEDIAGDNEDRFEKSELLLSLEPSNIEEVGAEQLVSGLRRRNRPE